MFTFCTGADELNFGGSGGFDELNFGGGVDELDIGGGGGMVLGGGGGMACGGGSGVPLEDDCTNFFGAGMVGIFLSLIGVNSCGFRNPKSCEKS